MADVQDKLTPRQKAFADEYLVDFNGRRSAIAVGYSEKTAAEMAYENLNKPHIIAYLQKRQQDRIKRTEITQDKVLQDIEKIKLDAMQFKYDKDGNAEMVNHAAALKACELHGKNLVMWTDKLEHTGNVGLTIEELIQRAKSN